MTTPRTLLVFVDALGLGSDDPQINPIHRGDCPCLERLLAEESVPVDAGLGVPGIPQSATGQTTLLTGVNAAKHVGRHVEGFPNAALKDLIRKHNLFDKLTGRGYRSTFANAYYLQGWTQAQREKMQSVTTVATLKAFGRPRDAEMMLKGEAVYQDLTRQSLRARGYDGPLTTPDQSARDLVHIASGLDFTLFEYFQTDRAAHKGDAEGIAQVLRQFDSFVSHLLEFAKEDGHLFLITSDHGGIEDGRTRRHTANPAPLVAIGQGAEHLKASVKSLFDFVPALLELYPISSCHGL